MLSNFCNNIIQNKNILMLFSVGIYILALFSTLSGHLFLFSIIICALFVLFIMKQVFPVKYIVTWTLLFLIGVINISSRLKCVDELVNFAPINSEITGTIISIPQGASEGKLKFFFEVDKIKFNDIEKDLHNEKVLVSINSNKNYRI